MGNKIRESRKLNIVFWTAVFYGMMLLILIYLLKTDLSSAPEFVYNQF